jgi:putative inorganic carbon (hco3(-)) transporter
VSVSAAARPRVSPAQRVLWAAAVLSLVSLLLDVSAGGVGALVFELCAVLSIVGVGLYALWHTPPAYALSFALLLSPFSSNWQAIGLPSGFAPQKLFELVAIATVLLRAPSVPAGRSVRIRAAHWILGLACLDVIVSAAFSGTLLNETALFNFLDSFGIIPFLVFLVAPVAFRTQAERRILLATMVLLGVYLGLTTLFETLHLNSLVFPKYILNPKYGDASELGRARGPFAAAVQNGFGLYGCACGSVLATLLWRDGRARACAGAVALLCFLGAFLTLQRSVWIAMTVATVITLLSVPKLRFLVLPGIVAGAAGVLLALALIPGLSGNVSARANQAEPVWERENLAVAAANMVRTEPLVGFGWGKFTSDSGPYFRQNAGYPLVGTTLPVHDVYLSYGAELGVIGLTLWALGTACGLGGAIFQGSRNMRPWRSALLAMAVFYLIVIVFVPPPSGFPPLILWLFAGVVWGGDPRLRSSARGSSRMPVVGVRGGPSRR